MCAKYRDAAIDFANEQISKFAVGDYIKETIFRRYDEPNIENIYRVKQITFGRCGFFSVCPPVFIVENVKSGEVLDLIRFSSDSLGHAEVQPFAYYDSHYHHYVTNKRSVWTSYIEKIDKVEIKEILNAAIKEKRREQVRQRQQEIKRKERERQIAERQKQNKRIEEEELLDLIDQLRK